MKTFFLRCFALSRLFVFATLPYKRDVKKKTFLGGQSDNFKTYEKYGIFFITLLLRK